MIELAYAHDSPLLPLCRLPNYTQNLCKNQPDPIADPIPNDDVLFPFDQPWGEDVFPDLPPLFRGRPDVHLRNGILNARVLASSGVPDAEKAFFVGDLSVVYKQHMRWTRCLPDIQPFYGMLAPSLFRDDALISLQRSSAILIPISYACWPPWARALIAHPTARSIISSQSVEALIPVVSFLPTRARPHLLSVRPLVPASIP